MTIRKYVDDTISSFFYLLAIYGWKFIGRKLQLCNQDSKLFCINYIKGYYLC